MIFRVSKKRIEVHDSIESSASSNPLIDRLARDLSRGIVIGLDDSGAVQIGRRTEWRYGSGEDGDAISVDSSDDLLVCLDELRSDGRLSRSGEGGSPYVVHSLEDHSVPDVGMCEDVALDAALSIRTVAVEKNTITTCCLVQHRYVAGRRVSLHACKEFVGPTSHMSTYQYHTPKT